MSDPAPPQKGKLGGLLIQGFFEGITRAAKLHPRANPARHGVEVISNVAYSNSGQRDHLLDIYRPKRIPAEGLPIVFYLHGGGFRILSKDTHWVMGLAFARRGYCVFNINYRLAPTHPFPAAVIDACNALGWVANHAQRFRGDLSRLILAGESAGANLASALAVATSYRRSEPWAQQLFDTAVTPRAVIANCGVLQVSDIGRHARRRQLPEWLNTRLQYIANSYLSEAQQSGDPTSYELADPLRFLELAQQPDRPLPPFYAAVGTKDPLLDDTRRLAAALDKLAVPCEARFFPGEVHAFMAFVWRKQAKTCWRQTFDFLDRHITRARAH
ncbi:MAG: alpha/beta hydrolase [Deltaproteobacteria bacterium]|nr:alpha/beta hydrolase [Deltaproteobacteria bacterium]